MKRTALGRLKHEGAKVVESDGRIVVYTGDDEDKEYLYKFVSDDRGSGCGATARARSTTARSTPRSSTRTGPGSGCPLVHGQGALTAGNGWADQADVLLRTRQAGDAVGATKLDRPEWVAVHPQGKDVYVSLTNGTCGSPGISPRNPNPYGHIVHIVESQQRPRRRRVPLGHLRLGRRPCL